MDVIDALRSAKGKISDSAKWVRGTVAVDGAGNRVMPEDFTACRWCAVGACMSNDEAWNDLAIPALHTVAKHLGYRSAGNLNDSTDHLTVMRMFDLAIRAAGSDGGVA